LLYRRGLSDLNAHKGAEAAAEFQKILDHNGRNWGPLYSLAYLGLARESALVADTAKAKRAYPMGFFSKNVDGRIDDPNAGEAGRSGSPMTRRVVRLKSVFSKSIPIAGPCSS
jgi:hypothetical protein